MEFATKEQLEQAVKDENYSWLGNQFWNVFLILPLDDKIRKYHSKIYDSLSKEQKEECENL